jgi:subtilisin family serine protease
MPRSLIAITLLVLTLIASGAPARADTAAWQEKVDPWVLESGANGPTEFLVFLADQADVSAAAQLATKAERGEYVYRTLSGHAERTQGPLRRLLQARGIAYRPYWVANMIWARGGLDVVQALAERADVARINANPQVKLDVVDDGAAQAEPSAPTAVEWNIAKVRAPDAWAAGAKGAGVVIAGQDTGYRWTHSALKAKYRGWNGAAANHDYNWHDAIHTTGSTCGANATEPCDDQGHGTHTMGTMVGDDGTGNQVGMAPDAKWIGCRNMNAGIGTPTTYSECYQWFIAPTKIDGTGADPSKAPDVINNSWGCPPSEGCTDPNVLLTVVQNVTAAGIVTVHSAGNSGSSCSTVSDPAAIYGESFTVGATDENDGIASFSSRGPVTIDGSGRRKPNISAPGMHTAFNKDVRSSYYTNDTSYTQMNGTSMAGPHVAGLVALVISANPNLRGSVDEIRNMIEQSAVHLTSAQGCGGDSSSAVPNNVFGWGRIDALAAVNAAKACVAPAAITDVAIVRLNASDVKLTWSAKAGASGYQVWRNGAPYFTPALPCQGANCSGVTTTTATQSALGNTATNYTWLVQPKATCGAVQLAPSNRVGEFEFGLVKGAP